MEEPTRAKLKARWAARDGAYKPRTRHLNADGSPRVTVTDQGPGIAPDVAERLYTSFFTTKPGGLGLGLSICRSIVEMHGGRIGHGPGERGGAAFHFTVPAGAR